ncbi:hypothetical protein Cgig2_020318 [Carnegiea gigantea]|uniref:Elongation factor Ts, mitochondrial n=1 Tax=Carnegiea gigantea TaxID=171969 RepID=A0A9Q1JUN8_9CARY|nr:hypothetical protein Cgig2_020318 [Carnegiea gigantea]
MMDCRRALSEIGDDLKKAQEYLINKGFLSADKKSSRLAAEGRVESNIHDARTGVLIEVNCETDFVGRNENFKELVDDLAMQVAACPLVQYLSIEEILAESMVSKEREIEMQREDIQSKPQTVTMHALYKCIINPYLWTDDGSCANNSSVDHSDYNNAKDDIINGYK